MMMWSGFRMNRDITPVSPHPPSSIADTATTVAKTLPITLWQSGSGRAAGDDSTYLGLTSKWVDRRLLVHDPCAPRRGGDHLGPLRDGADHPWRGRPLRLPAHPRCRRALLSAASIACVSTASNFPC